MGIRTLNVLLHACTWAPKSWLPIVTDVLIRMHLSTRMLGASMLAYNNAGAVLSTLKETLIPVRDQILTVLSIPDERNCSPWKG